MPSTATPDLVLTPRSPDEPAYRWLCDALRGAILGGRLRPGVRLPASRELARTYGLSRGTVVTAFELLQAEGYLEGRVGAGTYVSRTLPDALLQVEERPLGKATPATATPGNAAFSRRVVLIPPVEPHSPRAFRTNLPAIDLFPMKRWARVANRRLRQMPHALLEGCAPLGYLPLREAVAEYLHTSRGVEAEPERIAILSGVQEALDLLTRLLVDPGGRVGLENPGYVGARRVFEAQHVAMVPIPVDADGMTVPAGAPDVRMVYLTPGHQAPLGMSMSLARRLALLEWARATDTWLIEDDYDSEYRYAGRPLPALQGLDRHGTVIYAGSFSKVLFPGLRLGYLALPAALVDPVAAARSLTQRHASILDQTVLCDFMTEGHFSRHVRRMRGVYAERLGALAEAAERMLAGRLEVVRVEAGLQTVGWLGDGLDARAVADAARAAGIDVYPVSGACLRPLGREGLQLGFAAVSPAALRRGVERLSEILNRLAG
ncbi:MAG: PLP-dependent aminotransferase family protein [Rhodothermales bacterium]